MRCVGVYIWCVVILLGLARGVEGQEQVRLAWDPSPDPRVTGYRVSWGTREGQYTSIIDIGLRTDWTISGLDPIQRYYFTVQAYDATGSLSDRTNPVNNGGLGPAAVHDITGDRLSDLLWFNPVTAQVVVWAMSGPTVLATGLLNTGALIGAGWTPAGMGDLNADGLADIVWRHADGTLGAWLMHGTGTVIGSSVLSFANGTTAVVSDPAWKLKAVGDLNGDGAADLVWQHDSGVLVLWLMQGFTVAAATGMSAGVTFDPNWQIAGAGDIDGDGKADLIFQHITTGFMAAWLMNGAQVRASSYLSYHVTHDPAWLVQGVGDVNGDGYADLLWRHADGSLVVWYLNGFNVSYWSFLSIRAVTDMNWRLVGPS